MLGGSIVIETVFALHGVGFLAWESISKDDFPVVQAVVLRAGADLCRPDAARRPAERRARSEAAHGMSGTALPGVTVAARRRGRLLCDSGLVLGGLIVGFMALVAVFGPWLAP
jgi:hypothetical protein